MSLCIEDNLIELDFTSMGISKQKISIFQGLRQKITLHEVIGQHIANVFDGCIPA